VCLGILGLVRVTVVLRGDPWLPLTIELRAE
jgi:hypothetical protein